MLYYTRGYTAQKSTVEESILLYYIVFGIAVLKLMLVRSPMQVWKASGEYVSSITLPFGE